ncbi:MULTISPECIES: hypothetical protein [Rhodomicrobium]|uniref:hypothetical protein n=1 Tax=Rhodomicrobium TaxID=1068 RepID=UPI000F742E3E|nr:MULTISPECIES: hypothetical protein [Rhodomicrobium]
MACFRPSAAHAFLAALIAQPVAAVLAQTAPADRIEIALRGTILPKCEMAGIGASLDLGTLSPSAPQGLRELNFSINCNTPFAYRLVSLHDGLRHESAGEAGAGLATRLPYSAAVIFGTDEGTPLRLDCASVQLGPGCQGDSGERSAVGKDALLLLSWGPVPAALLSGRYRDELRLGLNPRD